MIKIRYKKKFTVIHEIPLDVEDLSIDYMGSYMIKITPDVHDVLIWGRFDKNDKTLRIYFRSNKVKNKKDYEFIVRVITDVNEKIEFKLKYVYNE